MQFLLVSPDFHKIIWNKFSKPPSIQNVFLILLLQQHCVPESNLVIIINSQHKAELKVLFLIFSEFFVKKLISFVARHFREANNLITFWVPKQYYSRMNKRVCSRAFIWFTCTSFKRIRLNSVFIKIFCTQSTN